MGAPKWMALSLNFLRSRPAKSTTLVALNGLMTAAKKTNWICLLMDSPEQALTTLAKQISWQKQTNQIPILRTRTSSLVRQRVIAMEPLERAHATRATTVKRARSKALTIR